MKMFFSHLTFILSLCFVTFYILDWYNPMMNFIGNPISSKLLLLFCVVAAITSVWRIRDEHSKSKSISSSCLSEQSE